VILSDIDINDAMKNGRIVITPTPKEDQLQPASIDLRLSNEFAKLLDSSSPGLRTIDPREKAKEDLDGYWKCKFPGLGPTIDPHEFILGCTIEKIKLPDDVVGRIEGRSSLGRHGLMVHSTAGFIDPGFEGQITLEMFNLNKSPIRLTPGMKICQIAFECLSSPAKRPYGSEGLNSKYQGQTGVTISRLHQDFLQKKVDEMIPEPKVFKGRYEIVYYDSFDGEHCFIAECDDLTKAKEYARRKNKEMDDANKSCGEHYEVRDTKTKKIIHVHF
jgi:dCTP deaminase